MATTPSEKPTGANGRTVMMDASPVQQAAGLVGLVFLLIGILGFVPGITTDYGEMQFAGHESEAMLLGIFQVSVLHNLVHLAFGVIGLLAMRTARLSQTFLVVGGAVYLVLWVYGLIVDPESTANFVPLNTADDWLHFGLGIGMIAAGLMLPMTTRRTA